MRGEREVRGEKERREGEIKERGERHIREIESTEIQFPSYLLDRPLKQPSHELTSTHNPVIVQIKARN